MSSFTNLSPEDLKYQNIPNIASIISQIKTESPGKIDQLQASLKY